MKERRNEFAGCATATEISLEKISYSLPKCATIGAQGGKGPSEEVDEMNERMLFVANGINVPAEVQEQVMRLLQPYDADCYEKALDS